MQLGVPILYVGSGEAEEIIKTQKVGFFSEPNNFTALSKNISRLNNMDNTTYSDYSKNSINAHIKEFNLEKQMDKLQNFINLN